jgi:predicted dehydrogenase
MFRDGRPVYRDSWFPDIRDEDEKALRKAAVETYGYKSLEELIRWRVYQRTGGGLMAELGSHQLDACSIFLGKVKPIAVSGAGGKYFYQDDREAEDHVFCSFEFPGKDYYQREDDGSIALRNGQPVIKNRNEIVVVTYSSISTNTFERYGECVMGTKGTMLVEEEKTVMLIKERDPNNPYAGAAPTATSVGSAGPNAAAASTSGSTGAVLPTESSAAGGALLAATPPSRGYREEMEHFAYCIRNWENDAGPKPRCHGEVAMADAIIALTSNLAMRGHGWDPKTDIRNPQRIAFKPEWFDPASPAVPEEDRKTT